MELKDKISENHSQSSENNSSGYAIVRFRAYIIGILSLILVCVLVANSELLASRGGSIDAILLGATHMPPGAIGVLLVIIFGNVIAKKISNKFKLFPGEMTVIYFMLVCAALISSFGLTGLLLPTLAGTNYYADDQNHEWRDNLFPHVANWLVPWDTNGPEKQLVSVRFYEGLRTGESVPWDKWVIPILAWLFFAFVLFYLMACIATLLRRQWVDNEKLSFPLVQLPMEMVSDEGGKEGFFQQKAMWIGFFIPVVIHMLNGIHKSMPNIPEIPMSFPLHSLFQNPPLNGMHVFFFVVSFSV
ncbi:MAG: DUF6785 family protein, partial [Armatimonadota bacterium]